MMLKQKPPEERQPHSSQLIAPCAAWMWKPRSKKVVENNNGGLKELFAGLRNVGAREWKRRHVFVEGNNICYGNSVGVRDKVIPIHTVRSVSYLPADVLLLANAPSDKAQFGWLLCVDGKQILFSCDNDTARREWVSFILAMLELVNKRKNFMLLSAEGEGARVGFSFLQSVPLDGTQEGQSRKGDFANPSDRLATPDSLQETKTMESTCHIDSVSPTIENMRHKLQPDMACGGVEKNTAELAGLAQNTDELGDGDLSDDEEWRVKDALRLPSPPNTQQHEAKQDVRAAELLPLTSLRYLYIKHKLGFLREHFVSDDGPWNIVFSRSVEKIGKRDTIQKRDLILSSQYLYLMAPKKFFGGSSVRCIATSHIVGVAESTTESNLLAILIPSFHDILIRFNRQGLGVGENDGNVKLQLIAHLYRIFLKRQSEGKFVFRKVNNVRAAIRRDAKEPYTEMYSFPEDYIGVGRSKELLLLFHTYGESIVFWSSMVMRVKEDCGLQFWVFVVTDGAFYIFNDTLAKVAFRVQQSEVQNLLFDSDSQTILFQCVKADLIFTVQSSVEFTRLITRVPEILLKCCGGKISILASKHLYSQLRVKEPLNLKDVSGLSPVAGAHRRSVKYYKPLLPYVHSLKRKFHLYRRKNDRILSPKKHTGGSNVRIDSIEKRPGSRAFFAHYRFVEEFIIDFEEEYKMLINAQSVFSDALALEGDPSIKLDFGNVLHSSFCRVFDLKLFPVGTIMSEKKLSPEHGERRVVCVTTNGVLLLHYTAEERRPRRSLKNLLLGNKTMAELPAINTYDFKFQDVRVAVFLLWSEIVGLVRCHPENSTVVGLMTNSGHPHDYMLDVENDETLDSFVYSSVWGYVQQKGGFPGSYEMLPLYTVPWMENVRNSLKSTLYHLKPTVALRCAVQHYASDELHLAVVPEIAEACRRFGDNTIYFSGVALKYSASAHNRRKKNILTEGVEKNKSMRKTACRRVIIVITNCAIYLCTVDGLEIVRRTELLNLKEVYLSSSEPDSLLITVPEEYDMCFFVSGRGKEFLTRLQEAYAAWTEYHKHLPNDLGVYSNSYCYSNLPVKTLLTKKVPHLAMVGCLKKPPHFDKMQLRRSANDIKAKVEFLHRSYLADAISNYEVVLGNLFSQQILDGKKYAMVNFRLRPSWDQVYKTLSVSKDFLEFAHKKAYNFSLRGNSHKEMERAQLLLYEFKTMSNLAESMKQALITGNLSVYEAAIEEGKRYPLLQLLLEETRERYDRLKQMDSVVEAISGFLNSNERPMLKDAEDKLQLLFEEALECGVNEKRLTDMRLRVDLLNQKEQFSAWLQTQKNFMDAGPKQAISEKVHLLATEVARQLGVSLRLPMVTFFGSLCDNLACDVDGEQQQQQEKQLQRGYDMNKEIAALREAIDIAVFFGNVTLLKAVLQFSELYTNDELKEKQAWGWEQYSVYRNYQTVRHMSRCLIDNITACRSSRSCSAKEIKKFRTSCEEMLRLLPEKEPIVQNDCRLLRLQLSFLTDEENRLAVRDSLQRQAKEAWDRCKKELQQRVEEDQHAIEIKERQKIEGARRRIAELLLIWQGRARNICATLEDSVCKGSAACVHQCMEQAAFLQKKMEECLAKNVLFSSCEQDVLQVINSVFNEIKLATMRGQAFLDTCRNSICHGALQTSQVATADETNSVEGEEKKNVDDGSDDDVDDDYEKRTVANTVPPELLLFIETYKPKELVRYVCSHEAELTADVIAKVRELWSASRERHLWVRRLHSAIHTALALKNQELLQTHIDTARTACYSDSVVEDALRVVTAMRTCNDTAQIVEKKNVTYSCGSGSSDTSVADRAGVVDHSSRKCRNSLGEVYSEDDKTLPALDLSRKYDAGSGDTAERLMGQLHSAALELFSFSFQKNHELGDIRSTALLEQKKMKVVQLWNCVFNHRLRSSGSVFSRRERNCFDLLVFIGEYNISGDYIAPYTNRLVSEFIRIKKGNAPFEQGGGFSIISYMLQRNLLEHIVCEIGRLKPNVRGDVLYEDALLSKAVDDLILLACLTEKCDWSSLFITAEMAGVCDTESSTLGAAVVTTRVDVSADESNTILKTNGLIAHEVRQQQQQQENACNVLRNATLQKCTDSIRFVVSVLSNYFAQNILTLGDCPSAESIRTLFDERLHKDIGSLVQEHLIPAVVTLLRAGFCHTYCLVRTRHVWDAVVEFSEMLQQGSRDLNGVAIGGIVQLVDVITDIKGRNRAKLQRFTEEELMDLRLRVFLLESFNRNVVAVFLRVFFQSEERTMRWASKDGLWKYYTRDSCVLYPPEDKASKKLMEIIGMLSELPFVLVIDRELW